MLRQWGEWKRVSVHSAALGFPDHSVEYRLMREKMPTTIGKITYHCLDCGARYKYLQSCTTPKDNGKCGGLLAPLPTMTAKSTKPGVINIKTSNDKNSEMINNGLRVISNPVLIVVAWEKYVLELPTTYCAKDLNVSPARFKAMVDNLHHWLDAYLYANEAMP